jgi:MarR family transcriptional regulator, organic hydroperoxide resistance regulator
MNTQTFPGSLNHLIIQLCRSHRARAATLLEEYGLYPGQERILFLLWGEEGLTLSKLAEKLEVQAPTITKMITRMESSGILERRAAPWDSRTTQVFLTGKGRGLKQAVERAYEKLERETAAGLSKKEEATFRQLLFKVIPTLSKNLTDKE